MFYKAHEGFDDFSNILWPEAWPAERLRGRRQEFIEDGDSSGYSQEFLNDPRDNSEAYLLRDDFLPMTEHDKERQKVIACAWDFAISKSDRANKTSCVVGGKDVNNLLHIVDRRSDRWNSLEIIDKMFEVESDHSPVCHFVEAGQVWSSIYPMLEKEMQVRDVWLNTRAIPSIKDKASRARPLQKRQRAHGMRFDMEAPWYPIYEDQLLRFTPVADALHDDDFDATSLLVKGFDLLAEVEEADFEEDEDVEMRRVDPRRNDGRSSVTGY